MFGFVTRWQTGESAVGQWLANTATGSFVKLFIAAGLGWVITQLPSWGVHPVILIALAASLPFALNWFNTADKRFGEGKDKSTSVDTSDMHDVFTDGQTGD